MHDEIRRMLVQACRASLLDNGIHELSALLSRVERSRTGERNTYALSCSPIEFKRETAPKANRLTRSDGAILSFSLTLGPGAETSELEIVAYRFDLRLPEGSSPAFLRFDMDPPGKRHDTQGLRAHIHPGHEEVRLPSAVLHPLEALSFLLQHAKLD